MHVPVLLTTIIICDIIRKVKSFSKIFFKKVRNDHREGKSDIITDRPRCMADGQVDLCILFGVHGLGGV